jgi:hypothetical protein
MHGTGWPPGRRVRVRLDSLAERRGPLVDRRGTFNYAVNQTHEFLPGPLPTGTHQFRVSVEGRRGKHARTTFLVLP